MTIRRRVAASLALLLAVTAAACDPVPLDPPDTGSVVIDCSRAAERLELTVSSHLDPTCTYTGGIVIATSGVTLDCQGARVVRPQTSGERTIYVEAPLGVALTDVTVRNCHVEGGVNAFKISRAGFRDYPEGEEFLTPTANILIEDNTFSGSRGVGVFIDAYVEDVLLLGNTIENAGSTGIYLETGSRRNRVEANHIAHNGDIENGPAGQRRTVFGTDLWFWGVGREGLAIDGSFENEIVGNVFNDNRNGAILLYKNCGEYPESGRYFERRFPADDNLIEGNVIVRERHGVWVGSRMGENTLPMDCTDDAYVDSGLTRVVLDFAADNTIRGNHFVDVTYGVRVEDDGTTVEGNTFASTEPGKHAVLVGTPYRTDVLGRPVADTTITGNTSTLAGNAFPYRWVHGTDGVTFTDNTALDAPAVLCEGEAPPRQPMIFVLAAAPMNPDGMTPTPPVSLDYPVLGELAPCAG